MKTMNGRRGLTIVEVAVVLMVLMLLVGILLPALSTRGCRINSRQIKDATQVRNIVQALTIFANGNRDQYPLPSKLDIDNATVADAGEAKDTTADILSILIYNSSISPELCVSPSEASGSIRIDERYQNQKPEAAVRPDAALWDPAFSGDFTSAEGGNLSYATLQTSEKRLSRWSNSFNAEEVVLGNRGPEIESYSADHTRISTVKKNSVTFAIHGGKTTWEGNIGYNDNHVNFETRLAPEEVT